MIAVAPVAPLLRPLGSPAALAAQSVHARVLEAVRETVVGLALPDLPAEQVLVRKLPLMRQGATGGQLPAVVISPHGIATPPTSDPQAAGDVAYDVLVTIFDRDNQEPTLGVHLDRHLRFRERIARALRGQPLTGVREVIDARVEPGDGFLTEAWKSGLLASALVVRFTCREARSMRLRYGSYQHGPNETSVVIAKEGLFSEAGLPCGVRERWTIHGRLQASSPTGLAAATAALVAAYRRQGQDVGFYFDGGQPTTHAIAQAATRGGVRVAVPPSFPAGTGSEFATTRHYTIVLEAELREPAASLVAWQEALTFAGGGPRFVYLEPAAGLPQKQLLQQFTTYRATQSGEAIGYGSYPAPAAPLWPDAEHAARREIRYELPRRGGPIGSPTYTYYRVTWSYEFEDAAPLVGTPTPWPA